MPCATDETEGTRAVDDPLRAGSLPRHGLVVLGRQTLPPPVCFAAASLRHVRIPATPAAATGTRIASRPPLSPSGAKTFDSRRETLSIARPKLLPGPQSVTHGNAQAQNRGTKFPKSQRYTNCHNAQKEISKSSVLYGRGQYLSGRGRYISTSIGQLGLVTSRELTSFVHLPFRRAPNSVAMLTKVVAFSAAVAGATAFAPGASTLPRARAGISSYDPTQSRMPWRGKLLELSCDEEQNGQWLKGGAAPGRVPRPF